jgi:hypothetical protein
VPFAAKEKQCKYSILLQASKNDLDLTVIFSIAIVNSEWKIKNKRRRRKMSGSTFFRQCGGKL